MMTITKITIMIEITEVLSIKAKENNNYIDDNNINNYNNDDDEEYDIEVKEIRNEYLRRLNREGESTDWSRE